MSLASVILLINNNIIPNNNNEITADVLRPILIEILQQPNDLIGVLGNLQTDDKSNLVNAVNEIVDDIGAMSSVKVFSGDVNPNTIGQQDANPGDLYSQTDALGNPIKMWIYDGNLWQSIDVGNAVLFTPQPLTATQQQIARDNVDVYSRDEVNNLIPDEVPIKQKQVYEHKLLEEDLINESLIILQLESTPNQNEWFDLHINGSLISYNSYEITDDEISIIRTEIEEININDQIIFRYIEL